jgi:hypothetical protein
LSSAASAINRWPQPQMNEWNRPQARLKSKPESP